MITSRVLRVALVSCLLLFGDAGARTPDALQCQGKVWKAVADVGPTCHGYGIDRICSGAAVGQARGRAERILAKRQAVAPPDACIPYLCAAGETPFVCADKVVTSNGAPQPDPIDGWQPRDFRCLRKSARLLGKVAQRVRRCDGDEAAACMDDAVTTYTAKLEQVVGTFVGAGASLQRCILGGCPPNADVTACVRAVVSGSGDAASPADPVDDGPPAGPPDGGNPGDVTPQELECRSDAAAVLAEFDARVAKCLTDADDLDGCLLEARGKREVKVAGLLDDSRVRPEVCFPGVCTAGQTPEACAFAVFELHAPGSGGPGGGDGGGDPPDPTQACRQAARNILDTLLDDVTDCHARQAEEAAAGHAFDVDACIQAAKDAQRARLLTHLETQLAGGVPPDECLPVLCADSGDDVTACVDAAITRTLEGS